MPSPAMVEMLRRVFPDGDAPVVRATPKHEIKPHDIAKAERKKAKGDQGEAFRDAVWKLDKGRCRATGVELRRQHPRARRPVEQDLRAIGEVDHSLPRSTNPDRIYDVSNGLLLQAWLNRLRKMACPRAPEFKKFDYTGPEDRRQTQRFIWRDDDGNITREEIG